MQEGCNYNIFDKIKLSVDLDMRVKPQNTRTGDKSSRQTICALRVGFYIPGTQSVPYNVLKQD